MSDAWKILSCLQLLLLLPLGPIIARSNAFWSSGSMTQSYIDPNAVIVMGQSFAYAVSNPLP